MIKEERKACGYIIGIVILSQGGKKGIGPACKTQLITCEEFRLQIGSPATSN